jgi:hypothetical protein
MKRARLSTAFTAVTQASASLFANFKINTVLVLPLGNVQKARELSGTSVKPASKPLHAKAGGSLSAFRVMP